MKPTKRGQRSAIQTGFPTIDRAIDLYTRDVTAEGIRRLCRGQALSKRVEFGYDVLAPIGRKAPAPGPSSDGTPGVELAEGFLLSVEPEERDRAFGVERVAVRKSVGRRRVLGAVRPTRKLRGSRGG